LLKLFKRHVIFLKPDCVVLYDEIESPHPTVPHQFDLLFHSLGDIVVQPDGIKITQPKADLIVKIVSPDKIEVELKMTPPAQDGKRHPYAMIHSLRKSLSESILTVLVPVRKGEQPLLPTVNMSAEGRKGLLVHHLGRDFTFCCTSVWMLREKSMQ
jgi:hypothetical protein